MTAFPRCAAFGRRIPMAELRRRGLPPRFGAALKSLVWAFKLSPETVNLPATETVREIEVMDLVLKEKGESPRTLAALVAAIDRLIPNPLIFRLFAEDDSPHGFALNLKASGGALHGDSDLFRLFQADSPDVPLPQGSASLETFLAVFAASVVGMGTREGETLRELDDRHYRLESLRADLALVERQLIREEDLARKYALAKERLRLHQEIDQCQN